MTEKQTENLITAVPLPLLVLNSQGKVIDANEKIIEVFPYGDIKDADVFALTGYKTEELLESIKSGERFIVERNEKKFRLNISADGLGADEKIFIIFVDITNFEDLKQRYNSEKPCALKAEIDNYDELIDVAGTAPNTELATEIDRIIRGWVASFNGSIIRVESSVYSIWFEQEHLEDLVQSKFEVLDKVRALEAGTDFPASLSIGIGVGGKTMQETESFAEAALELALGRGGDQAVIRRRQKSEFYGGTIQPVAGGSKGKSRIVGHALKQLMDQSRNVLIMGHRTADLDSFGASLGIARLAVLSGRKAYLVVDEVTESLRELYEEAKAIEDYEIINSDRAREIATAESLLVVCDTHRPSLTQCPELLNICEKIAVIDHHRRLEDMIEEAELTYMESYASSASELVSEIIQLNTSKKELLRIEAEALLAGMIIDTNSFAVKTGVRTFEAASWLRRQGADPTEIKRFFQEDIDKVKIKSDALARADIYNNEYAIATMKEANNESQILCAKIAEQLLTIKGIKASFAIGKDTNGRTVVSARSLSEVNVQVIMEKLGGGGHLNMAAAQPELTAEETKCKILEILEVK